MILEPDALQCLECDYLELEYAGVTTDGDPCQNCGETSTEATAIIDGHEGETPEDLPSEVYKAVDNAGGWSNFWSGRLCAYALGGQVLSTINCI